MYKRQEETTAEAASEEETKAAGGKLIMVTNAEFPPYEYHEGGEIVGIDADIARAIADELGMELEIEDIAFDSIIPELTSGKADFAMAGMTVDEKRKQSVDFSDTYAKASQRIIVKSDLSLIHIWLQAAAAVPADSLPLPGSIPLAQKTAA